MSAGTVPGTEPDATSSRGQATGAAASGAGSAPSEGAVPARTVLRWLRGAAGPRALGCTGLLCLLNAASALLAVSLAPVMQRAVDAATGRRAEEFTGLAVAFTAIILAQVGLRALIRWLAELSRALLDNRLRGQVLARVLSLSAREAERQHTAALMSRMTSDVQVVSGGVVTLAPNLLSMAIRLLGVLAVMYVLAPPLALGFMAVGALMVASSAVLRGILRRRHRDMQDAESSMRCFIQDCLESLLVVHAFGVEGKMLDRAGEAMDGYRRARMRKNAVSNAGSTGFSLAVQGGYVLGFVWCGYGILSGALSYGTLVAVIQLVGQIQAPIAGLGGMFSTWASLLSSAERLMEVSGGRGPALRDAAEMPGSACRREQSDGQGTPTALRPHVAPVREAATGTEAGHLAGHADGGAMGTDSRPHGARTGTGATSPVPAAAGDFHAQLERISFHGVGFAYDSAKPALEGLDLVFPKGSSTAVMGPSGAGKSTLMKLMLAAYLPGEGAIALEGRAPDGGRWSCAPVDAPAGLFAYVPQGNHLMAGTVRDAVAFAERGPRPDEGRVREALHAACADGFVGELPDGLDTRLGERGAGLSEGQRQRIAVARAVYSAAPVLLLDEATSALDADTERAMLERLRALSGRTLIIVTHRAEAVVLCDAVVRLGEGGAA